MNGIILNLIILIAGVLVLARSSVYIVRSLTVIAKFFNVSEFSISFILMAFATSLPELAVGVSAGFLKNSELSLGNIIGTNIVNITLILGFVALVAGRVSLGRDYSKFKTERLFNFVLIMSPVALMLDGTLTRTDGGLLLVLFVWSIFRLLNIRQKIKDRINGVKKPKKVGAVLESTENVFKNFALFIASAVVLLVASYFIVRSASDISFTIGLPELLVGIFVIGLGTSLPELAFGIKSARQGKGDMSLGNLLGSSVLNSTLILGATAVISPITLSSQTVFWTGSLFMAAAILLAYYFLRTKEYLVRKEGVWLVLAYIIFILVQSTVGLI